jgi:hypothetical protein
MEEEMASELHPVFENILAAHMPAKREPALSAMERLMGAYDALVRLMPFDECGDVRAYVRATNLLVDRCIECGMPHDEPDHEAWAAERVSRFLCDGDRQ